MCERLSITLLSALSTPELSGAGAPDGHPRCAHRVRSSAPMRRLTLTGVHTPLGHSHYSISQLPFAVLVLSSWLTWHDFAYVTMAQKVPSSAFCIACIATTLFWKDLAPTCPSPPTPCRNPRLKHAATIPPNLYENVARRPTSGRRRGSRQKCGQSGRRLMQSQAPEILAYSCFQSRWPHAPHMRRCGGPD